MSHVSLFKINLSMSGISLIINLQNSFKSQSNLYSIKSPFFIFATKEPQVDQQTSDTRGQRRLCQVGVQVELINNQS